VKRRTLLAATAALPLAPARAATWPERPLRLVVPFAAGTTTDILARLCGAALSQGLGQPVVADNRAGAGGVLGTQMVAQAAPDGYTLLFGTSGTMATNPVIMPSIPYDPLRDFAPIGSYARTSVVLGVRPQLGVSDMAGFLDLARRRPLSVGTAGTGTTGHLTTALVTLRSGVALTHVPYRDGARAVADLLNGTLDAMVYHPLGFLPHIRAGTIRPLAVTGEARHALFPEVPTLVESGLAGAVVEGWWALYAPAGTPAPVIARLNALVNASLADPATRAELERQGLAVMGGTPEALAAHGRTELARQREVAQAAGITAD
jgi:tripartite-type tricarboxylate transporter receptor subunit TctC